VRQWGTRGTPLPSPKSSKKPAKLVIIYQLPSRVPKGKKKGAQEKEVGWITSNFQHKTKLYDYTERGKNPS